MSMDFIQKNRLYNMNKPKDFEVVAHRGDRARYPENTLIAMQSALQKGCTFIECDIQLNADNCFYLLHDENFKRTSGIKQLISKPISKMTNAQVSAISVHEPDRFADSFKSTHVPRLEALLNLIQQFPLAKVMIEIKQHSLDQWGVKKVMTLLLQQLIPTTKQCIVISFNEEALLIAKKSSNLKIGWVLKALNQKSRQKALQLKPDYLIISKTKVPLNKTAFTGTWDWMLYDIESVYEAQKFAELGYFLMETDDICALIKPDKQGDVYGI